MSTLTLAALATLVFCAPGYPGGAGDAPPYVDQFAKAAAASAGWKPDSLAAIYDPPDQGSLAKLGEPDSVLAFMPYAFYVQHAAALHLSPLAQVDVVGVGTQERWTLVGKAGGPVTGAGAMRGYKILRAAGGEAAGEILSALRRVAPGGPVLALLDQTQAAALVTLPFAAQLKTLTQSTPLPVALITVVDSRLPDARAKAFQAALVKLNATKGGAEMLGSLKLKGFVLPQLPGNAGKP